MCERCLRNKTLQGMLLWGNNLCQDVICDAVWLEAKMPGLWLMRDCMHMQKQQKHKWCFSHIRLPILCTSGERKKTFYRFNITAKTSPSGRILIQTVKCWSMSFMLMFIRMTSFVFLSNVLVVLIVLSAVPWAASQIQNWHKITFRNTG